MSSENLNDSLSESALSDSEKIDRLIEQKLNDQKLKAAVAPTRASTSSKISFKPLHEGMGFHPFSDGLPYAPDSKAKYATGAGAVGAGRPSFSTHSNSSKPAVALPASTLGASKQNATVRQLQQKSLQQKSIQVQNHERMTAQLISAASTLSAINGRQSIGPAATTPTTAIGLKTSNRTGIQTATETASPVLRRRTFAYLMDTVIHAGFWITTNLTALFIFKFQFDSDILRDHFTQFLIFFLVSQWMFVALQEMLFENSIGKFFFNLEFKRNHSSLLLRSIVFMLGLVSIVGLFYRPQDKLGQIQLKQKNYGNQPV